MTQSEETAAWFHAGWLLPAALFLTMTLMIGGC